jgi:hypothetical protein
MSFPERVACSRCGRQRPEDPTWEEQLRWFDQKGAIVCSHCMTREEWDEAFRLAATRVDEPLHPKVIIVGAMRLAHGPDPDLENHLIDELVRLLRSEGTIPVGAVAAALMMTPDGGGNAAVRLFIRAIARLADEP